MKVPTHTRAYIEAIVDIRNLATCLTYYEKCNRSVSSRNELAVNIINDFTELLVKNGLEEKVKTLEDALAVFEESKLKEIRRVSRSKAKLFESVGKGDLKEQVIGSVVEKEESQGEIVEEESGEFYEDKGEGNESS